MRLPVRTLRLLYLLLLSLPAAACEPPVHSHEAQADTAADKSLVSSAIAELTWGMNKDALQKQLTDQIRVSYRQRLAAARNAAQRRGLRHAAQDEIGRIADSYVAFQGASTPWDGGFLRGEFTHGRGESMLTSRDQSARHFYFFSADKLWKVYTAIDAVAFPEGNFAAFAARLRRRFGPAKEVRRELSPGVERRWLEWQDAKTRLRTIDQTNSYGFYCLVFEDRKTVGKLAELRGNAREVALHANPDNNAHQGDNPPVATALPPSCRTAIASESPLCLNEGTRTCDRRSMRPSAQRSTTTPSR